MPRPAQPCATGRFDEVVKLPQLLTRQGADFLEDLLGIIHFSARQKQSDASIDEHRFGTTHYRLWQWRCRDLNTRPRDYEALGELPRQKSAILWCLATRYTTCCASVKAEKIEIYRCIIGFWRRLSNRSRAPQGSDWQRQIVLFQSGKRRRSPIANP